MKLFKKAKKGFTLVELVVVIAVIAILAGVSVGAYFGITDSANKSKLEQEAKTAWTTVRLASLAGESHSTLDSSGLTINSESGFKNKVNFISGTNYYIDTSLPETLTGKALIFDTTSVSESFDTSTTYKSFTYYDSAVTNKTGCKVDILSGKSSFVGGDFNVGGEGEDTPLSATVSTTELVINEKENDRITVQVTGGKGNHQVTWTSSDTTQTHISIAQQVDNSVKITANNATNDDQVVTLTLTVSESGFDTVTKEVTVRVNNVANPVTHIVLDKTYLEFEASDITSVNSKEVRVTTLPVDADNPTVSYSVEPSDVASVTPTSTGCTVTPLKVDDAVITVTSASATATINVVVNPAPVVEKIVLETSYIEVSENADDKQFSITPILYPSGVIADISYSSNKENVATVTDNGVITANNPGTAVISVTAGDKSAAVTVVVTPYYVDVEGISLNKHHIEMEANVSTEQLEATIYPSDANRNTEITWESLDTRFAEVTSSGLVTAKSAGSTQIIARANGFEAICSVTVNQTIPVSQIIINRSNTGALTANGTSSVQLYAVQLPQNANNKEPITWKVAEDSKDYITVSDQGLVVASDTDVTTDNAKVIASANGISAEITISTKLPSLEKPVINSENFELKAGTTKQLTISKDPWNAAVNNNAVTRAIKDNKTAIAEVSSDGLVTAIFPGTCYVTATLDGKTSNQVKITVTERDINDQFSVARFLEDGFDSQTRELTEKYSLSGYIAKWDTETTGYQDYGDFWLVDSLDQNPSTHGIYVGAAQVFDKNGGNTSPIRIDTENYRYKYDNSTGKKTVWDMFDVGDKINIEAIYEYYDSKNQKQLNAIVEPDDNVNNKLFVKGLFNNSDAVEFTKDENSETRFTYTKDVEVGENLSLTIQYGNALDTNYYLKELTTIANVENGKTTKKGTYTFAFDYLTKSTSVKFKEEFNGQAGYYLVTDSSELEVGDTIIIAAETSNYALGPTGSSGNNRSAVDIQKSDNTLIPSEKAQRITLEKNSETKWNLKVGEQYLYAASSTSNQLKTNTIDTASFGWNITIDENNNCDVIYANNEVRNIMHFNPNGGSPIFNCYSAGKDYEGVCIYKLYGSEEDIDDNIGDESGATSNQVTVTKTTFSKTVDSLDSVISYSCAKGGGTSDPAINDAQIRLYQGTASKEGGNITINAESGYIIKSITIGSGMSTSIKYEISGAKSEKKEITKNGTFTYNLSSFSSITFHCCGTTSSTRLYVNYISVTYELLN